MEGDAEPGVDIPALYFPGVGASTAPGLYPRPVQMVNPCNDRFQKRTSQIAASSP